MDGPHGLIPHVIYDHKAAKASTSSMGNPKSGQSTNRHGQSSERSSQLLVEVQRPVGRLVLICGNEPAETVRLDHHAAR